MVQFSIEYYTATGLIDSDDGLWRECQILQVRVSDSVRQLSGFKR